MTTWELIRIMVQKDHELQMGRHDKGLRGYWAVFIKMNSDTRKICDECEEPEMPGWSECGHAMTAHRAVVMASRIALGIPVAVPPLKKFEL